MPFTSVSDLVRSRATADGHQHWLEQLGALVAELEAEWSITVGRSYDGGNEAFVADATMADGSAAVLKVFIPTDDNSARNEMTLLRLADGDGCARLLRSDLSRSAMLVERLGAPLGESGLPASRRREILCTAAERIWRVAPDAGLPTGADKGRQRSELITRTWEQLGRPCSERAVEYALNCAQRRIDAHDDSRAVLVHGDVHEWNALKAGQGYKLIDPDGLLAEREYDLGVIMRADPIDLADPHVSARWLANRTGLGEAAIWEWAAAQRLASALVWVHLGHQTNGDRLFAAAEEAARIARYE